MNFNPMTMRCLLFIALAMLPALAHAQAVDPVERAMERIEVLVEQRAAVAEQTIAAAKLRKEEVRVAVPLALNVPLTKALPRKVAARYGADQNALARILAEERVPVELLAVAYVESRFNPQALSPKGARGIWQFMPETAQRYGLLVEATVDQRTHPEHSTRAAARYLQDLYRQFGDWKLALAAYNTGEARMQRLIKQTGLRDFDVMARRGLLPLETRNYVPAVLAVWQQLSQRRAEGKK